jgi:hypothetical protein
MGSGTMLALVAVLAATMVPVAVVAVPGREADVVQHWHSGDTTAGIAEQLGCTQRRVQQILSHAGAFAQRRPVHPQLAEVVQYEATRHGANYGYQMLLGALRAHHGHGRWSFPRRQVYAVLHELNPEAYEARRHWAQRRIGREMYFAPHFLYSVHIDLACKLQEYGIYVGAAIDGASRMALSLVALTDKLPVTIYDSVFVPMVTKYGFPDQLMVWERRRAIEVRGL